MTVDAINVLSFDKRRTINKHYKQRNIVGDEFKLSPIAKFKVKAKVRDDALDIALLVNYL